MSTCYVQYNLSFFGLDSCVAGLLAWQAVPCCCCYICCEAATSGPGSGRLLRPCKLAWWCLWVPGLICCFGSKTAVAICVMMMMMMMMMEYAYAPQTLTKIGNHTTGTQNSCTSQYERHDTQVTEYGIVPLCQQCMPFGRQRVWCNDGFGV